MSTMTTGSELSAGLQALMGRMVADVDFRRALAADPAKAVVEAGIELSVEEMARLQTLSVEQRQQIVDAVDSRDAKGWWYIFLGWFSWW